MLLFLFIFHPIKRVYIQSTKYFFMSFVVQLMNTIKYEMTTFYWPFQPNLISRKNWLKNLFYNFIFFIINHHFYFIALQMQDMQLIAIIKWISPVSDFLRLFMISFKYGWVLLTFSSINSVLFLSPLILYLT